MIVYIAHNSGSRRTGYNQQTDQCMRKFNIADPQQTHQNHDIGERITKVILTDYDQKRQYGKQTQRHDILPEEQPVLVLADQHCRQKQDQDQLKQFRRLEAESAELKPALGAVLRFTNKADQDQYPDPCNIDIERIFDDQPVVNKRQSEKGNYAEDIELDHLDVHPVLAFSSMGHTVYRENADDHQQ
ncbi:hypothetical protein D3C81_1350720 [compost metagenome]